MSNPHFIFTTVVINDCSIKVFDCSIRVYL